MDTLLGMMQGYTDDMKTLKAQMAQVQSGAQQNGMVTYAFSNTVYYSNCFIYIYTYLILKRSISISEIEIFLFKK